MAAISKALDLIKKYEGFSPVPYLCPGGVWTIGYGHTEGVNKYMEPISELHAGQLLKQDLEKVIKNVHSAVKVPLNDSQYAALYSFVFNLGTGNFKKSTLLKKINKRDFIGAAGEFERWVFAGGKKLAGLERRRKEEKELFEKDMPKQGKRATVERAVSTAAKKTTKAAVAHPVTTTATVAGASAAAVGIPEVVSQIGQAAPAVGVAKEVSETAQENPYGLIITVLIVVIIIGGFVLWKKRK